MSTDTERRTEQREVDEQFRALMEGLRTSLPGVQVLFAFLLIAPFQASFADMGPGVFASFTVAFLSSGIASVLLISPSVHQRLRAPASGMARKSEDHLQTATKVTIAGTVCMGVAIIATVFLVASVVFSTWWAAVAAASIAAVVAWAWFYLPLIAFPGSDD